MSHLGGFDSLEVALLGEVGSCTISREVRGAGFSCGRVELISEEGKEGGPPRLRTVSGAFGAGVRGKKSGEAREMLVEPGFKGEPGGERMRLGNGEVFEKWGKGGPIGQGRLAVGEGGGGEVSGCESRIRTGTCSEPVEGRGVSHV